jgi:hypothetical protein
MFGNPEVINPNKVAPPSAHFSATVRPPRPMMS